MQIKEKGTHRTNLSAELPGSLSWKNLSGLGSEGPQQVDLLIHTLSAAGVLEGSHFLTLT